MRDPPPGASDIKFTSWFVANNSGVWAMKIFDQVHQGKWRCALLTIAWPSPRAMTFPSTPVPSHLCLNKGLSTANPSCLGRRWLSVVEGMTDITPLTPAPLGLQETSAGLTFTTWGASQWSFKMRNLTWALSHMISGSGKQIDLTPFCFSKTNKFKKDWDFHLRPIIFNMSSCQIIRVSAWLNLNPHHSSARSDPTVWTPLSLPNSAVLLGGWGGSRAHLTAEIMPGIQPFWHADPHACSERALFDGI